ncbi:MAG: IS3 family transposase [Pseudomonadota bacterium]
MSNQAECPIVTMALNLGVSRGGFYAWQSREPSAHNVADRDLTELILRIHAASKDIYGAPRVQAEPADSSVRVGHRRVERLTKAASLTSVRCPGSTRTTIRYDRVRHSDDLVDRNVYLDRPNMLWAAGITYVPTSAGFTYLAVVLDAFSPRIVGWPMGRNLKTQLLLDAMNIAIGQRRPSEVIHHSDQSSQYMSVAIGLRYKEAGVRPSTGSVGNAYENSMCESFFATSDCEFTDRRKFRTKAEARMANFEFIEGWFNPGGRHSILGYLSTIDYERSALETLESSSQ